VFGDTLVYQLEKEEETVLLWDWLGSQWFQWVHTNNLVYNSCWEDPRLDRVALKIGRTDNLLVITSAGCNVLDYALVEPNHIYAVDMNPRQNALLELKIAAIRELDFETFFAVFGRGRLEGFESLYRMRLRRFLSSEAASYWDSHCHYFSTESRRQGLYFHGTTGLLAWWVNQYINCVPGLRDLINCILDSETIEEQQQIYFTRLKQRFWGRFTRGVLRRDAILALLGVPRAQREQVERHYSGGIARFVEDCLDSVFAQLPLCDNYFWRVYLTGEYSKTCCPEYLKEENFIKLKHGLVDRISVHTDTIQGFLEKHPGPVSRFVLLDHMDWLWDKHREALRREWQAIVDRAAPSSRVIWRSGGLRTEYLDTIDVVMHGYRYRLNELLTYKFELAAQLHTQDRVHTYGSFYIADFAIN